MCLQVTLIHLFCGGSSVEAAVQTENVCQQHFVKENSLPCFSL